MPQTTGMGLGVIVNVAGGGVSTILIFLTLTVFVPPLVAGNAVTSKVG